MGSAVSHVDEVQGRLGLRAGHSFPSQRVFRPTDSRAIKGKMVGCVPKAKEKAMAVTKRTGKLLLSASLRACRPLFSLQNGSIRAFIHRWKLSSPQPFPGTFPRLPKLFQQLSNGCNHKVQRSAQTPAQRFKANVPLTLGRWR